MTRTIQAILVSAAAVAAVPFSQAIPYNFISLSGDYAEGRAPVSLREDELGYGWIPFPRDNSPFIFGFNTALGWRSYLDIYGFGFTLSDSRETLYANGSLVQPFAIPYGGLISANFVTGLDGIAVWHGSYQVGGMDYTASGTGRWVREGAVPIAVPDNGSTFILLGSALSLVAGWGIRRTFSSKET